MARRKEITGVRIKLATADRIHAISRGEVLKPETINYRTLRPETDGLFCEKIFGPTRSYECKCGKYKRSGPKFKGIVCEHCGVEVTDNRVRRERMGHIDLAVPVVHIWYLRGIPSRLSLLLGVSAKDLERVIYFAPLKKPEKAFKVTATSRPDLVSVGAVISSTEMKIHAHYDPEFRCEKAYVIEEMLSIPVNVGDVISSAMLSKYKTEFGDGCISAEPAFALTEPSEELGLDAGAIVPASKAPETAERSKVGSSEAFIVTSATKRMVGNIELSKGKVLSESEFEAAKDLYPYLFPDDSEKSEKDREKEKEEKQCSVVVDDPCHLVILHGSSPFEQGDVIFEHQQKLCAAYDNRFEAGIGADGVLSLINRLDLDFLADALREQIADTTGQKKRKLIKRLQVVEDFRKSNSLPQSMILTVLPVIPPDLRPLVQLDGGRFATSDLNDLYRRVINRNNRLKKLQALNAPEIIVRNEKRMLQECVDALIDNGRVGKAVLGAGNRPLKSLTDLLRGKKGRFRQNLLGKRVDYSGRSVIVIGPELKIYQCGLPKQMALELFKPFVIRRLVETGLSPNVKNAKRRIEKAGGEIWEILENIIKDHPVMLNRAPTLHRLGIQAFEPVLMEGKAIRLHPMVCTAFNADFDGDQMAVHVPLSIEAQAEARLLMLSANNLLSPASGRPVVTPTQDIVLGVYYLTDMRDGLMGEGSHFMDMDDVLSAISHGTVHVNAKIWLKENPELWGHPAGRRKYVNGDGAVVVDSFEDVKGEPHAVFFETSPGRVMFNTKIPAPLRFANEQFGKKRIGRLLDDAYDKVDRPGVVALLDDIKSLGYHWAARSGISFGVQAVRIPDEKAKITNETQAEDDVAKENYEFGLLTYDEYLDQKSKLWAEATKNIADSIQAHMSKDNPVRMMVDSGARGSKGQLGQMAGIRGLMADPTGKTIDYPITANFREGMNMLEYFISTHGARKGLADTALRTAKSGYLTRRLVDVSQDLIITEHDCGTDKGICIRPLISEGKVMIGIAERIAGRTSLHDIEADGEVIVKSGEIITEALARKIEAAGFDEVWVRSPLACTLKKGVCQKCYGHDLSSRKLVPIGEAVGVVAAQSIGEPGTQLTMRTFHTGGVRSAEDITQGLPRIEQLFEVRRPRKVCILAGVEGRVKEIITEGKRKVIIEDEEGNTITHAIPSGQDIKEGITEGMEVDKLTPLTEGSIDPQQLLEVEGITAVQKMLVDEIQYVYHSQGVSINNKHIEVILRKVAPLNKLRVIEEGDTSYVAGDMIWEDDVERTENEIKTDNEKRVNDAVMSFAGDVLVSTDRSDAMIDEYIGQPLTEEVLRKILTPGVTVKTFTVLHGNGEIDVIIGKSAFRKRMLSARLLNELKLKNAKIRKNINLSRDDLKKITAEGPITLRIRHRENLDALVNKKWLASEISIPKKDGKKVIVAANEFITPDNAPQITQSGVRDIYVWNAVEHVDVVDGIRTALVSMDMMGKDVFENGESSGKTVDEAMIDAFAKGEIEKIEYDDGEAVLTIRRIDVLRKLLAAKLRNKLYVNGVFNAVETDEPETEETSKESEAAPDLGETNYEPNNDGRFHLEGGMDIRPEMIAEIAAMNPVELWVRALNSRAEIVHLIREYTFVQRMREFPECRPFIHGITKAALATDSFLSAASFQQTAQVLAGAAVKGEMDSLSGLKENVIIGHLIPAGTGAEAFRKIAYNRAENRKQKAQQQAKRTQAQTTDKVPTLDAILESKDIFEE